MRLAKKSLLVLLSFFVVISGFVMPVSASTFKDTDGHWAQTNIAKWSEKGILKGHAGSFRPNDPITRAEFSTIIHNIMKYTQSIDNPFTDLSSSDWYYDAMVKLNAAGVLAGNSGQAMPEKLISRQEAAVLVARAFDISGGSATKTFADQAEIADWALHAVSALVAAGAIQGKPDGSFDPTAPLTRAEAVTIISNLIEELYAEPGEYTGDIDGNVVVNADDVVLNDMEITGDLFIAQGVGEGEVTLNNVVIGGKVIVEGGGANSIIFNNVQVRGALVVNKYNGTVRILATGNTSVSVTTLQNGAMIVTRDLTGGGFETIEIPADIVAGANIVLDGNFKQVVNYSPEVSISATGKIAELVAEANTNISGDVTVNTVSAKDGVTATVNDRSVSRQPSSDAVCQGYAAAYSALLNAVGIPNYVVSGSVPNGSHAWNAVQLNGQWYYIDPTWNDMDYGLKREFKQSPLSFSGDIHQVNLARWKDLSFRYFLRSEEGMADHQLYFRGLIQDDTKYDEVFESGQFIGVYEGDFYFVRKVPFTDEEWERYRKDRSPIVQKIDLIKIDRHGDIHILFSDLEGDFFYWDPHISGGYLYYYSGVDYSKDLGLNIFRIPLTGGAPESVVQGAKNPEIVDNMLYYTYDETVIDRNTYRAKAEYSLHALDLESLESSQLIRGRISDTFALDDAYIYLYQYQDNRLGGIDRNLIRLPLNGGAAQKIATVEDIYSILKVIDGQLFYTTYRDGVSERKTLELHP